MYVEHVSSRCAVGRRGVVCCGRAGTVCFALAAAVCYIGPTDQSRPQRLAG